MKKTIFKVGDRVAYSATFLRNISAATGDLPQLRGEVKEVSDFGQVQLCVVKWDGVFVKSDYHDDGMARIIAPNLTLKSQISADATLADGAGRKHQEQTKPRRSPGMGM